MDTTLLNSLKSSESSAPPEEKEVERLAATLSGLCGSLVYPRSMARARGALFFLGRQGSYKSLGIISADSAVGGGFQGKSQTINIDGHSVTSTLCETSAANAPALRAIFPFLAPQTLGLRKSAGCGDRLGLATPGHVRAIRRSSMAPILAQQSMRENARTGRTPQQVMDEAMWGIFQEGWRDGFGADADHLKTTRDIDLCMAAGYTFFTIDPGEYVDNSANTTSAGELQPKLAALPWTALDSNPADLEERLAEKPLDLGDFSLTISREELG